MSRGEGVIQKFVVELFKKCVCRGRHTYFFSILKKLPETQYRSTEKCY